MQSATLTAPVPSPVLIPEVEIDGETLIVVGSQVLVKAKSKPGNWYSVEDGRCTCPGFTYRGACRHIAAAQLAVELDRMNAEPMCEIAPAAEPTPEATYWVMSGEYAGEAVRLLEPGRWDGWDLVQHIRTGARFTVEPGGLLADQPAAPETVQPSEPVNLHRPPVSATALFTMPED